MRNRSNLPATAVLAMVILMAATGPAGAVEGELGFSVGFTLPDHEITGRFGETMEPDVTYGLRGGVVISPRVEWFADLISTSLETVSLLNDGDALELRTGIDIMMNPGEAERWFISAGAGYSEIEYGLAFYDFDYTFGSIGFGQRYNLQGGRRLRWEIRADVNPSGAGLMDERFLNLRSVISLTWGLGASEPGRGGDRDSDGDGVPDGRDACPATHPRTTAGEDGCSLDSDGDNVADGLDVCPGTPSGALVGLRGCPLDTDRDGVYDGIDRCRETADGATVDEQGCPI